SPSDRRPWSAPEGRHAPLVDHPGRPSYSHNDIPPGSVSPARPLSSPLTTWRHTRRTWHGRPRRVALALLPPPARATLRVRDAARAYPPPGGHRSHLERDDLGERVPLLGPAPHDQRRRERDNRMHHAGRPHRRGRPRPLSRQVVRS